MQARTLTLGLLFVAACGGDDSSDGATVRLLAAAPAAEAGLGFKVVAQRIGDASGALTLDIATSDVTASAGADYAVSGSTVSWADGDSADKTITIEVVNDLVIEGDEMFGVTLRDASGASLGTGITLMIQDDDRVGEMIGLTSNQRLVSFDRDSATILRHAVTPSGLASGEAILGVDIRPRDGKLYALTDRGGVYVIDPATGVASVRNSLAADPGDASAPFTQLSGGTFGLDFNPVVDRLRVVSDTGQNLRIDVDTGRVTTDATIRGAATGLAAAGYANNIAEACRTRLYGIDVATDRLVIQDPPNDGTTTAVGAGLGVAATSALLDLVTIQNGTTSAFAVMVVDGQSRLYSIDVTTGVATQLSALALTNGETLRGLAIRPPALNGPALQAAGEIYGITEANRLISFNRAAPAKACTSSPISGMGAAESIVGFDVRPSTGVMYALANNAGAGALYVIDPATGNASNRVALSAPLVGAAFGVDFNPTGPVALRIVSDAGQNLRVTDVATGTTVVDGALNGPSVGASGAAYTNAVPGAGATTLYTIDPTADRLRIQTPPNAGTQVDVGALGVDAAAVDGFDIDGRDNAAFVALALAGSAATTFHTVDLTTGAVSASLGTLGARLRGMARPTPATTVFGLIEPNQLVTISLADPTSPTVIGAVAGLAGGESLHDLDFRPSTGLLYGLGTLGGLYEINPATAAATRVSTLTADATDLTSPFTALTGADVGIDFNPTGPVALRVISDAEQNLRIPDVTTGTTITDLDLTTPSRGYQLGSVTYSSSFPGATTTTLYGLDSTNSRLVAIVSPNSGAVRELRPLPPEMFLGPGARTFEIVAADTALVAVGGPPRLLSLDLATGTTTSIGQIQQTNTNGFPFGAPVGLAAPPSATAPAADSLVYAIDAGHQLVRFPRNQPGQAVRLDVVEPVDVAEAVVAIDFRPSTGELWMLTRHLQTNVGRLYTLEGLSEPGAVIATLRATLAADPTDPSSPYAALEGGVLGMNFNPTGPVALRIVSATGQNLRIPDPSNGRVITDGAINTPAPDAKAAAYSNSFAGALATTLYVIDVASGQLMIQAPPNNGVLAPVGALSATRSFSRAVFDIGGGGNGVAVAALQVAGSGETFSRLFRMDLATGLATEVGAGIGSGGAVRGLAIRVR